MRIERIIVSGFRGFRNRVEIPVGAGFTIIDGRNGVGKSTIFDAIEFALTGRISKYGELKAAGESIEDYIWWKGDGPPPLERLVEVTFSDSQGSVSLRRTPIDEPDERSLARVEAGMVKIGMAPSEPLAQLCAASIIRDENIASLSLDLSETQRYAKLRQAIGASDADRWADRAEKLVKIAKRRSELAKAEVSSANIAVTEASRKIDDARATLATDVAISDASLTLSQILNLSPTAPDQLVSPGRELVAERERQIRDLQEALSRWEIYEGYAEALDEDEFTLVRTEDRIAELQANRAQLPGEDGVQGPTEELVRQLHELRQIGEHIGIIDHKCPLCAANHDAISFQSGLLAASAIIQRMDADATTRAEIAAERRGAIAAADKEIADAERSLMQLSQKMSDQRSALDSRDILLGRSGLDNLASRETVEALLAKYISQLDRANHAIRILSTLSANRQLDAGLTALDDARVRLTRAQDKAGRARKAEATASALHDAARRAGFETLDLRLGRVLPLMSELYGRLRPHPVLAGHRVHH
ncbi:AAA family ATPase [Bradyrhizobium sp. LB13.1]